MRVILAVILFAGVALARPDGYTTKYDNINLDEILNNDRLYQKYFQCLTNKGKCTPDGKQLKDILPDALKSKCAKCNERQRKGAEKVFKYLLDKKPNDYKVLEKIYDPQGVYRAQYKSEAEKRGIKI
ncbi:ejaculatory bulb-specific protein 3 [Halyomorpha halys]|uniref:ejaculatory bulb-specific protein 3 n=1 Tax=Halyomorpha halys TaxID=286706 RepID=UPI0006D4E07B|nr:ejaculatory bulb-specific protein 3-like [Halyomorpha halys]